MKKFGEVNVKISPCMPDELRSFCEERESLRLAEIIQFLLSCGADNRPDFSASKEEALELIEEACEREKHRCRGRLRRGFSGEQSPGEEQEGAQNEPEPDPTEGVVFKRKPQRIAQSPNKLEESLQRDVASKFTPVVEVLESRIKIEPTIVPETRKAVPVTEIITVEDSPVTEEYSGTDRAVNPTHSSPKMFSKTPAKKEEEEEKIDEDAPRHSVRKPRKGERKKTAKRDEEEETNVNQEEHENDGKFRTDTPKRKKKRKKKS
jgi:hypothetical protein